MHLAQAAAELLAREHDRAVRVVSMPCWEAFARQDAAYRDSVLPPDQLRRMSVEAGSTLGWDRHASAHVGLDHFGASAPAAVLAEQFGFTPGAVAAAFLAAFGA